MKKGPFLFTTLGKSALRFTNWDDSSL